MMLGSKDELIEFEQYVDREMCEFLIGMQFRINSRIDKDERDGLFAKNSPQVYDFIDEEELTHIKTLQGELYKQTLSYLKAKNKPQREAPALLSMYIKYVQVCVESEYAEGEMLRRNNGQYH